MAAVDSTPINLSSTDHDQPTETIRQLLEQGQTTPIGALTTCVDKLVSQVMTIVDHLSEMDKSNPDAASFSHPMDDSPALRTTLPTDNFTSWTTGQQRQHHRTSIHPSGQLSHSAEIPFIVPSQVLGKHPDFQQTPLIPSPERHRFIQCWRCGATGHMQRHCQASLSCHSFANTACSQSTPRGHDTRNFHNHHSLFSRRKGTVSNPPVTQYHMSN